MKNIIYFSIGVWALLIASCSSPTNPNLANSFNEALIDDAGLGLFFKTKTGEMPDSTYYQAMKVYASKNGTLTPIKIISDRAIPAFKVRVDTIFNGIIFGTSLALPDTRWDTSYQYAETILEFKDGDMDTIKVEFKRYLYTDFYGNKDQLSVLNTTKTWYNGVLIYNIKETLKNNHISSQILIKILSLCTDIKLNMVL